MSMNTKKNISIVLLVLALLLWMLRKMNVLYIPGLSMVLLGLSMIMVGIMMFQVKEVLSMKSPKRLVLTLAIRN